MKDFNDPSGTLQMAWTKEERNDKYYLNRFEVDSVLYGRVEIGDQFTMGKHYKYKLLKALDDDTKKIKKRNTH